MTDNGPRSELETLKLRAYTPARVSLGRTGSSIVSRDLLDFRLCHALARDAVHARLGVSALMGQLRLRALEPIALKSAARNRTEFLRRPDLGRKLSPDSLERLCAGKKQVIPGPPILAIVIGDGLSALAVENHAVPLIDALLPSLREVLSITPVVVVEQARVAIGDEVGNVMGAALSLVLIGERPGLSSPDSLGAYITWEPKPGRTDAERNCVSNIRTEGLSYQAAAQAIAFYLDEGLRRQLTGVALKSGPAMLEG